MLEVRFKEGGHRRVERVVMILTDLLLIPSLMLILSLTNNQRYRQGQGVLSLQARCQCLTCDLNKCGTAIKRQYWLTSLCRLMGYRSAISFQEKK